MPQVVGCHMVGSVPLPDTETVLRTCTAAQPNRLKRIPDGETGFRNFFTFWQAETFKASPELITKFTANNLPIPPSEFSQEQVDEHVDKLKSAGPLETNYDNVAIQSYQVFERLKDEGVVPLNTRFQVSIATAPNTLTPFVQFPFQAKVEPLYQDALDRAIRNIQEHIPHDQLAIELDLAVETAFWEGHSIFQPWYGNGDMGEVKKHIVENVVHTMNLVDKDVEVGLHNCYGKLHTTRGRRAWRLTSIPGDMEHRHFMEPTSLAAITERGLQLFQHASRPINFFHVPVPKSALDKLETYFEPLKELIPKFKEHNTDLYLGVVHYDDRAATDKMLEAAKKVIDYPFGVATECGWGRTPSDQINDIMKTATEISEPAF